MESRPNATASRSASRSTPVPSAGLVTRTESTPKASRRPRAAGPRASVGSTSCPEPRARRGERTSDFRRSEDPPRSRWEMASGARCSRGHSRSKEAMLAQIIRYATSHPKRVIAVWLVARARARRPRRPEGLQRHHRRHRPVPAQALGVRAGDQVRPACIRRPEGHVEPERAAQALRRRAARTAADVDRARRRHEALASRPRTAQDRTTRSMSAGAPAASSACQPARRSAPASSSRVQWKANTTDPVAQDVFRQFRDRRRRPGAQRGPAGRLHRRHRLGRRPHQGDRVPLDASRRSCCSPPSSASACCSSAACSRRHPAAGDRRHRRRRHRADRPRRARLRLQAGLRHAAADHGRARRHRHRLLHVPALPACASGCAPARTAAPPPPTRPVASARSSPRPRSPSWRRSRRSASRSSASSACSARRSRSRSWSMLLAGVTFMPAIAAVSGRALFWPSKRWMHERTDGPAARLGLAIARRPGRIALAVTMVLVALATAALGTKMNYDLSSSGPSTAATRTADEIAASLPRGATDPQQIYVRSTRAAERRGARADAPERGARRRRRQRLGPGPDRRPPRRAASTWPSTPTRRASAGWTSPAARCATRRTPPHRPAAPRWWPATPRSSPTSATRSPTTSS